MLAMHKLEEIQATYVEESMLNYNFFLCDSI